MLTEPLHVINQRLKDYYGVIENGMTRWRVVWSTDQTEKRLVDYINGVFLGTARMMEVPKYPLAQNYFILERVIPVQNLELITSFSYEPIWVFRDRNDNPLPPKWEAIEFLIQRIHEQMAGAFRGPKYKQENETDEMREAKIKRVYDALYGNETEIGDRLALGEGVGYIGNSDKEKVN